MGAQVVLTQGSALGALNVLVGSVVTQAWLLDAWVLAVKWGKREMQGK
jgi:hypothetical protein